MPHSWTALYTKALQADPSELLDSIRTARRAISARMRELASLRNQQNGDRSCEQRALSLALSDLRVLMVCFRPRIDPVTWEESAPAFKFSARHHKAGLGFVNASLTLALTFCRIAQCIDPQRGRAYLTYARRAYHGASRYFGRLEMSATNFNQATATAERVRFLLNALENNDEVSRV